MSKRAIHFFGIFVACLSLALLAPYAAGQGSEGTILGHVKDTGGGLINGATITVTNPATGLKRTVQSADDGAFIVVKLPPGNYHVETSYTGFGNQIQEVTLLVAQSLDLNIEMRPAGQQQKVTVEAVAPLIETNTATLHKEITPLQVEELPVNGRDFTTLATLVPGVTAGNTAVNRNYDPTKRNVPAISINGGSGRLLFMTIDGGDNTDMFMGGQNITLSLEAVEQFDVTTHDPKAQYLRGLGGVVTVATKSGTNSFHGSAFGFFRDDAYEKIDHFSAAAGKPKPPFNSQQFGGTIGGPVMKDRLFFFYSYERDRNNGSRVFNSNGKFPTFDGTATPQTFRQNLHTARVDGRINASNSWFVRYAEQDNITANEFFSDLEAPGPSAGANETNKIHDAATGITTLFGSNMVNDFRFHYQYWQNSITNKVSSLNVPTIILPDATFGASQAGTQAPKENMWQWSDDFSIVRGRHNIRFGGTIVYRPRLGIFVDFRHNRYKFATDAYDPTITATAPAGTVLAGNSLVNFRSWSADTADIFNRPLTHYGFFVQDDIRLGRVTIAAGLRYDYFHNLLYFRGSLAEQLVSQNIGLFPGSPKHKTPSDDGKDFGPRIAAAWDVKGNGQAVVRAGYGRLYDPSAWIASNLFAELEVTQANGGPPFQFVFVPGFAAGILGVPCSTTPCQPAVVNPTTFPFSFPIGQVVSPDGRVAYADQYHGGFSYQFREGRAAGLTIDIDGIYSRTRRLNQARNLNFCLINPADTDCQMNGFFPTAVPPPNTVSFPQAGTINFLNLVFFPRQILLSDSTGRNNYEALIISARKDLTKWYQLFASYTLSQSTTDTDFQDFTVFDQLHPHGPGELGPTNFDERHRVVISGLVRFPYGIQWSTILTGASARPYTPVCSFCDTNMDGVPTQFGANDGNGAGSSRTFLTDGERAGPRGSLRGNPTFTWDMRIAKIFRFERISPQAQLEGLFEVFNLTNKANYGQNYNDSKLLLVGGVQVPNPTFQKPINIITPPLQGQFGVRFRF